MSEEAGKDLCPMCSGTGSHDLRPPKGRIYVVEVVSAKLLGTGERAINFDEIEKRVNAYASVGYELHRLECQLQMNCVLITLKWRWP